MDDVRLALLGDKAAQERLTERGELLPCPFCGEEKTTIRYVCGDYFVDCLNCHSTSSITSSKDTVVKDWNTRAFVLTPEELEIFKRKRNGKINQWISVKDKMPEQDRAVLIWCPIYRNIYCAFIRNGVWRYFEEHASVCYDEVTHWMPLPNPPNET